MSRNIIFQDLEEVFEKNIDWECFRNSSVLVTGSYGMLASYVVFMLIYLNEKHGYNIRIISLARSLEKLESRFGEYCKKNYFVILADSLENPIYINEKIDFIIHAASLASPKYYSVCPVDVLSPNVIGTYYLLKLAVEKNVKNFLLFSSGDIYGKTSGIKFVTEKDMGVIDPLDIHSCYSESKRMAETMCYSFFHQYGVPIKILRIWHTYAPTMDIEGDPRVFASFVKNILDGEDIIIKSSGETKRSFCYISDAIGGFFTVMTQGKVGEAYNICNTDQFMTIKELAEKLASFNDITVKYKSRNINEHYTENTAIGDSAPSNEKLQRLGWESKIDVVEGFSRVLAYLKGR